MKKRRLLPIVLLLLGLIFVACQGQAPEPERVEVEVTRVVTETEVQEVEVTRVVEGEVVTEVVEVEVEVEVVATPTPQPAIKTGGTLRVAISTDVDTFDPHVTPLTISGMVTHPVFNTLVKYDENLNIVPDLAEWEIVDALTWRFMLQEGVMFHNGREMTAADVVFSLERGQKEDLLISKWVANLESIVAVDDYTVEIKLIEPRGYWLNDLLNLHIIPEEEVDNLAAHPIGTGAFRFVEWVPNDRIVLERNDDYWDGDKPYLDGIVLRIIPDVQARLANLESGDVDAVRSVTAVDSLRYLSSTDINVLQPDSSTSTQFFHMMGANNLDIWGNKRVRQALAHCLDKETIRNTVFLGQGQGVWSGVAPSSFAYVAQDGYEYNPEITRQIMEEEGISNFEFTVEVLAGNPEAEQIVTIWQAGCAEADVTVNLRVSDVSLWLDRYLNQDYDVTWNGMGQPGDPNNFYNVIVGRLSRGNFCGPSGEEACYKNDEYAELLAQSNTELDQDKQIELLTRIQEIIVDELPVIMIQTIPPSSLARDHVQGWGISARGDIWIREVWLDQ